MSPQASETSSTNSSSSTSAGSTSSSPSTSSTAAVNTFTGYTSGGEASATSGKASRSQSASLSTTRVTFTSLLTTPAASGATISLVGDVPVELAANNKSGDVTTGAAIAIGIGTAIAGIIIGVGLMMLLSNKKKRSRRSRSGHGVAETMALRRYDEKSASASVVPDFDLDRLLPQPLDDGAIRAEGQKFLAAIDAHVENFYTDQALSPEGAASFSTIEYADLLVNPASRFFAIKRVICQRLLASLDPACPINKSLLPGGFCGIGSHVQPLDLDNRANSLCWSRLRTSFACLVRDETSFEKTRMNRSINTLVNELGEQFQPIELPGQGINRKQDLDAICRAGAQVGKILLSQPAVWIFGWDAQPIGSSGHRMTASSFTYFPALLRLTNNKGENERTPHVALEARIMR